MKKRSFLITLVLLLLIVTVSAGSAAANEKSWRDYRGVFWLTVLHNNDGESDLLNLGSGLEDFGGAARFKTVVDQLKWTALNGLNGYPNWWRGVVMVSSGDNFLAGPEFNASQEKGVPFFDTIAMDLIGYDAVAIGNHDFAFGPDVLADFVDQ